VATSDTPKFQFWRFFFSLKGRVSRRAFAVTFIPARLAVWGADELIRAYQLHTYKISLAILGLALGAINLMCLWPKFAVSFKRLQDFSLPGAIAAILFTPLALNVWNTVQIVIATHPLHTFTDSLSDLLFYVIWGFAIVLCLIPGNKGANRYGSPPRGPQTQAADVF
jgi:uncharacterized membrane protein YhaH (DUF805 family)